MELYFHTFLISETDASEWSAYSSGNFTLGKWHKVLMERKLDETQNHFIVIIFPKYY
jgi:hypothetical protein